MKDSERVKSLFERSVKELSKILGQGVVEDRDYAKAVIAGLNVYTKLRNIEVRENVLRFAIGTRLSENIEGLKETLKQQLPEYVGEK